MYKLMSGLLTCLVLAGCGGGSDDQFSKNNYATQSCPSNMTCGFMKAPKDYNNPNGEQVDIYYGVHKALDPANRIGSLILNFGGPSAEAVVGASKMATYALPQEILNRFDIVGMDPRGTGQSAYARELTDCAVAKNRGQGDCTVTYQQYAPYLGSNSVVKDIDRLRNHLGDEKLTFLGYSYGTRLGSLYAHTFPDRVRAIVLDSPMSPTAANNVELRIGNTAGYDKVAAFRLDYATYPSRETRYQDIATTLYSSAQVYTANDGQALSKKDGADVMDYTVARDSSRKKEWSAIRSGLKELLDNDKLITLKNELSIHRITSYNSGYSNLNDELRGSALFKAVVCTDERLPLSENEMLASELGYKNASALFGGKTYAETAKLCNGWSARRDPIAPVTDMASALGGKQILIIGGLYDPATPYTWTEEMVANFGASASKVTVDNYVDHGFSYSKISCVDQKTTAYLLDPETKIVEETCNASALSQSKSFMIAPDIQHPAKDVIGW
ncbi:alpha/beta hydrolase [Photobacterium chitinilyticum]|uniref:alpha/beta hydrolase n=1 Tax=Photobacterium chitinilyticum TaxID=2485123 RepID=UPI003D11ABBA